MNFQTFIKNNTQENYNRHTKETIQLYAFNRLCAQESKF